MAILTVLPNALSLSRIPMGLALILVYDSGDANRFAWSLVIICAALLSDVLDGRFARALKLESQKGYILDGLGDKSFYVAFFLVIIREQPSTEILCWFLIVREITLYGFRTLSNDLVLLRHKPFMNVSAP